MRSSAKTYEDAVAQVCASSRVRPTRERLEEPFRGQLARDPFVVADQRVLCRHGGHRSRHGDSGALAEGASCPALGRAQVEERVHSCAHTHPEVNPGAKRWFL